MTGFDQVATRRGYAPHIVSIYRSMTEAGKAEKIVKETEKKNEEIKAKIAKIEEIEKSIVAIREEIRIKTLPGGRWEKNENGIVDYANRRIAEALERLNELKK